MKEMLTRLEKDQFWMEEDLTRIAIISRRHNLEWTVS